MVEGRHRDQEQPQQHETNSNRNRQQGPGIGTVQGMRMLLEIPVLAQGSGPVDVSFPEMQESAWFLRPALTRSGQPIEGGQSDGGVLGRGRASGAADKELLRCQPHLIAAIRAAIRGAISLCPPISINQAQDGSDRFTTVHAVMKDP